MSPICPQRRDINFGIYTECELSARGESNRPWIRVPFQIYRIFISIYYTRSPNLQYRSAIPYLDISGTVSAVWRIKAAAAAPLSQAPIRISYTYPDVRENLCFHHCAVIVSKSVLPFFRKFLQNGLVSPFELVVFHPAFAHVIQFGKINPDRTIFPESEHLEFIRLPFIFGAHLIQACP